MTDAEIAMLVLVAANSLWLFLAVGLITWGNRFPRGSHWVSWCILAINVGALGYAWNDWAVSGYQPYSWIHPWVGPITIGFVREPLGLAMASITLAWTLVLFLSRDAFLSEARSERYLAAVALAALGASIGGLSATPWLSLLGLSCTIIAGFLSYGSRWNLKEEAEQGTREAWEGTAALMLCVLGVGMTASGGGTSLGDLFLLLGLFLQFKSFPLLGSIPRNSEAPALPRIALSRIFPAFVAFEIIIRLESQLRASGMLEAIGWAAMVSALLAWVSGLPRQNWRASLGCWISGALSVALIILANGGARAALLFLIGTLSGSLALAASGGILENPGTQSQSSRKRATWGKVIAGFGAAISIGMFGFASGSATIPWFAQVFSGDQPAWMGAILVLMAFGALLIWKTFWSQLNLRSSLTGSGASWPQVLSPWIFVVGALALIWTGDPLGGVLQPVDQLMPPLFGSVLEISLPSPGAESGRVFQAVDPSAWNQALGSQVALLFVCFLIGYWLCRRLDRWHGLAKSTPRFVRFVTEGFGIDALSALILRMISRAGKKFQAWLDIKLWNLWIPATLALATRRGADTIMKLDEQMTARLEWLPIKAIEVPAKLLQLIHNGDIQWYLLLAFGSGAAILIHFLYLLGST